MGKCGEAVVRGARAASLAAEALLAAAAASDLWMADSLADSTSGK